MPAVWRNYRQVCTACAAPPRQLFRGVNSRSSASTCTLLFHLFCFSFFLSELEKCLEDPDRVAPLFIKHVSGALVWHIVAPLQITSPPKLNWTEKSNQIQSKLLFLLQVCCLFSFCRNVGCICTSSTARTNPNLSTSCLNTSILTLR